MKTISRAIISLLLILVFCLPSMAQSIDESPAEDVLQKYFNAFNHHNVDSVMIFIADDFQMYSVTDTTRRDISGRDDLRKWLESYFADLSNVSSTHSALKVSGKWVSFIETAHWGEGKSASSLAVYEVVDKEIRRIRYYY